MKSASLKNTAYSIFAILACLMLGKLITYLLGGLPASLYGMIIFSLSLHFKLFDASKIAPTIAWIISNMGVCFVPAGVGIINHFELIEKHGLTIVFIIFTSTFLLLTTVGYLYEQLEKHQIKPK